MHVHGLAWTSLLKQVSLSFYVSHAPLNDTPIDCRQIFSQADTTALCEWTLSAGGLRVYLNDYSAFKTTRVSQLKWVLLVGHLTQFSKTARCSVLKVVRR